MISVPTKHLKAALLAAGKNDLRYYLNGVLVESSPGEVRCVATDGFMVAVLRHATTDETLAEVIVPRDVVEAVVKAKRPLTNFEQLDEKYWLANGTHRFEPVEGKFPPYRRIMPTSATGVVGRGFSPELFAQFGKMAIALGASAADVTTHPNGFDTAAISIEGRPEFAGALCSLRFTEKMGEAGMGIQGWAAK